MKHVFVVIAGILVLQTSALAYAYSGALDYVICDIKRPLAGLEGGPVDRSNYKTILDGMAKKLNCNGLRTYIDPALNNKDEYSKIYKDVFSYAREQLGMVIYANPLGTGDFSKNDDEYVKWIVEYANGFKPDFIGPFNEPGMSPDRLLRISTRVRDALSRKTVLVGPDLQKVAGTMDKLKHEPRLLGQFDILSAHNAEQDEMATPQAWRSLSKMSRDAMIWASENPRGWSVKNASGQEIGVRSTVESENSVSGLVIYLAFPNSLNEQGELTEKGRDIARHIGDYEKPAVRSGKKEKEGFLDKLERWCDKVIGCD